MQPTLDPFLTYILPTIKAEGGYSNDPNDRGKETMWGVTAARARAAGYIGPMRDMPQETAVEIFRLFYWKQPGFDQIHAIAPTLALLLLDLGVNFGPGKPAGWLQRCLNVLNGRGKFWPDLTVDGLAGAMTRAALKAFIDQRGAEGQRVLDGMVRSLAAVRYIEIAEADPSQEDYVFGWERVRGVA